MIDELDRDDVSQAIRQAMRRLTFRERELLRLRFGLDGISEHTLLECGQAFGLSAERTRSILNRALRKLEITTNLYRYV